MASMKSCESEHTVWRFIVLVSSR